MKHYNHLTEQEKEEVFYLQPKSFNKNTPKSTLSKALGALLYMPATRPTFAEEIINSKHPNLTAMVLDFEDACDSDNVESGKQNLFRNLKIIEEAIANNQMDADKLPLMFMRVRSLEQFQEIAQDIDKLSLLTGFNFPKFGVDNAIAYLNQLAEINQTSGEKFYCMPILESPTIMYKETRYRDLQELKRIIDEYKQYVLNIRIGGTDFSSLYSIRRSIDATIYDVVVVKDCICDILNTFNRAEDEYVVSGVVWEFFSNHNRLLKPSLRLQPFVNEMGEKQGNSERKIILDNANDGLIREVIFDKMNGIVGKTIIHPSHIGFVNALQVVTFEEYMDALMIVQNQGKGVLKSYNGNKMNEVKPHLNWATKILQRAEVYGVLNEDKSYVSLFIPTYL